MMPPYPWKVWRRQLTGNSLLKRSSKEWKVETGNNETKSLTEVEVMGKAERRRFTAEYKLKVLGEANHCKRPGEIGALLRREGLYWSNLTNWGKQRERGELAGLSSRKRGPQRREKNPLAERVRELERDNMRLNRRAWRA